MLQYLALWIASSVNGVYGRHAQSPVAQDRSCERAVLLRTCFSVALRVRRLQIANRAMHTNAQWIVNCLIGDHGAHAPSHAVVVLRHVAAP